MKKLIQSTLLVVSILLTSGCEIKNVSLPSSKPKIDENLPVIDASTIKMLPDMAAVALEWKGIATPEIKGYHLYRANIQVDGQKLKRVATIDTKYASHYLDDGLEPSSQYLYAISTIGANGMESRPSQSVVVNTLRRLDSVSFITAVNELPKQIKVLWRPHTNKRVASYIIERSDQKTSKWIEIDTVKPRLQAEYIDSNLGDSVEYSYRVRSVTFDNIVSLPSDIVKARTKPLPPSVTNIEATLNLPRKILLTWTPLEDISDIVHYNIYRSSFSGGLYTKLAQAAPTDNTFSDLINYDGEDKFYKITTVDKDGLESILEVAPTMGKTLEVPARPVVTLAQIQGAEVILNWKAGDNRTVSYNIHKTIKENLFSSKTETIPNITDVRFEDKDIVRGITYEYRIEAIDEHSLISEKTPATSLTIPQLEETEESNAAPATK